MNTIKVEDLSKLFEGVAEIFDEKKDELCEMDANMGRRSGSYYAKRLFTAS